MILGYNTTNSSEVLADFIATAKQQYDRLLQAIASIDEKINDLQRDWEPRPFLFWRPILKTDIPAIREATLQCLFLFDKERSKTEAPIPIIICGTGIGYRFDLHQVNREIEECGIKLTAYLTEFYANRSAERQIRDRQSMMRSLEALSEAVHKAVKDGHAKLESAFEEHQHFLLGSHLRSVASYQEGDAAMRRTSTEEGQQ